MDTSPLEAMFIIFAFRGCMGFPFTALHTEAGERLWSLEKPLIVCPVFFRYASRFMKRIVSYLGQEIKKKKVVDLQNRFRAVFLLPSVF
jgi:hypothetical protein